MSKTWRLNKKHFLYHKGYCYERNNRIYFNVLGERKSTGLTWSETFKTQALALLENEIISQLNADGVDAIMPVSQFFENWRQLKFKNISPAMRQKYGYCIKHFITEDLPLDSHILREHILQNAINSPLAQGTIARELRLLRGVLEYAVEIELIKANPISSKIIPKIKSDSLITYSNDEIRVIIKSLSPKHYELALLVEFIWITGLRIAEALEIKREDVLPDSIRIYGKGGYVRHIPLQLHPRLKAMTKKLLTPPKKQKLFRWGTTRGVSNIFRKYLKQTDTYKSQNLFHAIRRRTVNNMIESGIAIQTAAAILGHTIPVMHKHYIEVLGNERALKLFANETQATIGIYAGKISVKIEQEEGENT